MPTIGEHMKSTAKDIEILTNEIAIFKNLIQERAGPLDLVRELLSNAGAREVGATRIEISYTKDREGHIFEVRDNGCGMNYSGRKDLPLRLDRFLGLGLSAIGGQKSDEFSWKGLGSKLAYQSRRVDIETRHANQPLYVVRVNEPWNSLDRSLIPKPRVAEYPEDDEGTYTQIKVTGHPPHRLEEPFTFEEIRTFLLHRTFAGFTSRRDNPPQIVLAVLGTTEELEFGFPEFKGIHWPDGFSLDTDQRTLTIKINETAPKLGLVVLKGFLTWEGSKHGLHTDKLNTGLILSSRGIPYFELDMEDYGARSILPAQPGKRNTCLVVECDGIYTQMNISRSALVDSEETVNFKRAVRRLINRLESSQQYLDFRQIRRTDTKRATANYLADQKRAIEAEDQKWVLLRQQGKPPLVLMREPQNESEVNALVWKLEALGALPFEKFQTLAYVGARKGPDLLVNFQEERASEPLRSAVVEVERNFYSYKTHGHYPAQYPKVICWDIPTSGRKVRLEDTSRKYKFKIEADEYQVHVYVLSRMEGVEVVTRRQLQDRGIQL